MPTIKKLLITALLILLSVLFAFTYGVIQNNKTAPMPSRNDIEASLNNAVDWLHDNKQIIMRNHNTGLWWMLKEASDTIDNPRLKNFYEEYKEGHLDKHPRNIWTPYFIPEYKPYVPDIVEMLELNPYQIFFIYALSCDADLGSEPVIQQQQKTDFCKNHFLHPRCVTHQLMGVRLLQQRNCGQHDMLASQLLDIIETEIYWDFRVTDSYLQRVLMLVEGGRQNSVKPVWIQRILDAQLADGSWADFYPVLTIGGKVLGFSSTWPTAGHRPGDFHATAQGIWLMALLLDNIATDNNY